MSKPVKMLCDNCGEEIILSGYGAIKEHVSTVEEKKIYITYFECQVCHQIYKVSLRDEMCKDLIGQINAIKRSTSNKFNAGRLTMLSNLLDTKQKQLKEQMEKVQVKYNWVFTSLAQEIKQNNRS